MKERKSERAKERCRMDTYLTALFHSFTLSLFFFVQLAIAQPRASGIGPGERYYPVHNFQDDFQVYDENAEAYVPYIAEQHANQTALSAYVDLESNRHYSLLISTRSDGYLFINAALKRKLQAGQWQVLSIDSLYRLYRQPEIFLTIYGTPGLIAKQLYIGYPKSAAQKNVVLHDDNLSVRPRSQNVYTSFLSLGLLFLLVTHAFLFTFYHRAFLRFYSLRDVISLRAQDESFLINRPLSSTNTLFTLNLSFVIAYLLLFIQSLNLEVTGLRTLLPGERGLIGLMGEFFLVGGMAFFLLIGKYVLLEVIGGLYKFQEVINVHFFKVIQSSSLFFTTLTLLLIMMTYNTDAASWSRGLLLAVVVGFYAARLGLLYLLIRNLEPVKNLYLFSYLCIVELIPLIIGVRFAL